jgi:hypothetical protein
MHVVTVETRPKPLRRDIMEVREVGALRERAISSRPLFAVGMRARPYTLPWAVCCALCTPSSPTTPAAETTYFVAALGNAHTFACVSRTPSWILAARDYGQAIHTPGIA